MVASPGTTRIKLFILSSLGASVPSLVIQSREKLMPMHQIGNLNVDLRIRNHDSKNGIGYDKFHENVNSACQHSINFQKPIEEISKQSVKISTSPNPIPYRVPTFVRQCPFPSKMQKEWHSKMELWNAHGNIN